MITRGIIVINYTYLPRIIWTGNCNAGGWYMCTQVFETELTIKIIHGRIFFS